MCRGAVYWGTIGCPHQGMLHLYSQILDYHLKRLQCTESPAYFGAASKTKNKRLNYDAIGGRTKPRERSDERSHFGKQSAPVPGMDDVRLDYFGLRGCRSPAVRPYSKMWWRFRSDCETFPFYLSSISFYYFCADVVIVFWKNNSDKKNTFLKCKNISFPKKQGSCRRPAVPGQLPLRKSKRPLRREKSSRRRIFFLSLKKHKLWQVKVSYFAARIRIYPCEERTAWSNTNLNRIKMQKCLKMPETELGCFANRSCCPTSPAG